MRRREFITLLDGTAVAWPPAVAAGIPRIGYLCFRSHSSADDAFLQSLRALGWIEGQNIYIDRRFAAGDAQLLKDSAIELVHLKVDLIFACASQSTQAAKEATTSIPIVFASARDPVGQKFVASLAQPGGNITGTSFDASPEMTTKQIQLLVDTVPDIGRVAILWNPTVPFHRTYWQAAQKAAASLHVTLQSTEASDPKDLEPAFEAMVRQHAEALVVLSDGFMTINRATLAQLAAKYRIPAIYGQNLYTTAGGLMSYGPSLDDLYRRAAPYVDNILKGSKPADLPVEQPVKFYLIINLRTAKDLGLSIPQKVLTAADEVIE
jgi:putative tryptophan/tyrosine transport system substrate-binding protein